MTLLNKKVQSQENEGSDLKKNTPIPEGFQSNESNEKFHTSGNLQKSAVPHQRNELNANQEQRPDRQNPQRNIDK